MTEYDPYLDRGDNYVTIGTIAGNIHGIDPVNLANTEIPIYTTNIEGQVYTINDDSGSRLINDVTGDTVAWTPTYYPQPPSNDESKGIVINLPDKWWAKTLRVIANILDRRSL